MTITEKVQQELVQGLAQVAELTGQLKAARRQVLTAKAMLRGIALHEQQQEQMAKAKADEQAKTNEQAEAARPQA